MLETPATVTLPLHTDAQGVVRVSGTRVTLDVILARYLLGESPETIHAGFPVVPLADLYAVIGYYLANRPTVDAYLAEGAVDRRHADIEATYPQPTKADLLARR